MAQPPAEPVIPVSDDDKPEPDEPNTKNEKDADNADDKDDETTPAAAEKIAPEPTPATTIGTYIFVGMLYFIITLSIINLPYVNGMMISVYLFVLFVMLVVMNEENQFVRTSIMIQLSVGYFLLFLLKTAEFKGQTTMINIDRLIRIVIITTFVGIVPFILPGTIDFVKYVSTREI